MVILRKLKRFLFAMLWLVATDGFTATLFAQKTGFINIDCGRSQQGPNYAENTTELFYASDAGFIDTGESRSLPRNEETDKKQEQMLTLRSFPEGIRNCYRINITSGTKYFIQASFFYGNYDGNKIIPVFELHLGSDLWDTIETEDIYDVVVKEIIHVPLRNYIHICLVKTGFSTPFISEIQIRPLSNSLYPTPTGSLALVRRIDFGSEEDLGVGFPKDVLARYWDPCVPSDCEPLNTASPVESKDDTHEYQVPSVVMQTAVKPINDGDSLRFWLSEDNTTQYYVFMHFAEVEKLQPNYTREFKISYGDVDLNIQPFSPKYLETETLSNVEPLSGGQWLSIYATRKSNLPPIINAYEVYSLKHFSDSDADQNDYDAITTLKTDYRIKRNWQGDPCTPKYLWEGVNCTYYGHNKAPRIISLNLSSSTLTGDIPPSISDLIMIQSLDLSNNRFTGPVPDLSHLPNLTVLNLENNDLTGSIPVKLIEKWKNNVLTLRVCGNEDLVTAPLSCPKRKNNNILIIVASCVGTFILLLTVVAVWWGHRSKKQNNQKGSLASSKQEFTYSEIIRITNNLERVIGQGGFGTVYHGYIGDTQVAVKMLSPSAVQGHQQFLAEVNLLIGVHHKNLTKLIGYCDDGKNTGLVYEYMANGNLKAHISDHSPDILKWEVRLQIALDAAQGLEYLHHGCKPPIIHRDVKLANILLNENLRAKISDFGLSKIFSTNSITISHISTVVAGTPGYLDPEYTKTNRLNEKSDVYSFGVVLLEIITGRSAIDKSHNNIHVSDWVSYILENGDINSIVDPRLDGIFEINSAWKVAELAINCVSPKPSQRPTMSQVVSELKECLDKGLAWTKGSPDIELTETRPLYSITDSSPSPR